MDPNSKQSVVIDAVGSLASDIARFNPSTSGDGPINRMPNEIMELIMAKLELNGDVANLVRLRSVSTRWKALVEDYFEQKKSLIVVMDMQLQLYSFYDFEKRFFGFAKLNNFTRLHLDSKIPLDCLRSLLAMFPNIVQLSINCFDRTRVSALVDYINSLDSLKQLDLVLPFVLPAAYPTLSKLEHFSIYVGSLDDDERLQLISHLEPSCVRVFFERVFTYDQVRQWHTNNPNWLANLTHLGIWVAITSEECAQLVHYLSEHATSMKLLNLKSMYWSLELRPTLIRNLSKLRNLAELELCNITMDIRELTETIARHELTSVVSVLTCKLYYLRLVDDQPINFDQFSRVLSVIFPNLAQLDLSIRNQHLTQQFRAEFEQHLNRFPKLRIHNIN